MSDACSTHETDEEPLQSSILKSERKIPLGRLGMGRRILLKQTSDLK
jgi:hypothetical protein